MNYTHLINFEWDHDKSDKCFTERGFDFAYIVRGFIDPNRIIQKDTRREYGEDRYQLLGIADQRLFVVVYTLRGATFRIISARKANRRGGSNYIMKTIKITIDPDILSSLPEGRVDFKRLDATTEDNIAAHKRQDETDALFDAAKFARRVRKRPGLSQAEFSRRIDVSLDTIRNWEQGKRQPTGAAKTLLKILDKAPEAALAALK